MPDTRSDLVDLEMRLLIGRAESVLVTLGEPSEGVWLPLSQIEMEQSDRAGYVTVTMPQWLAENRKLI